MNIAIISFAAVALLWRGCEAIGLSPGCSDDAIQTVTLRNIHIPDLGSCGWLKTCAPESFAEVRKQTQALREWTDRTEMSDEVRRCYRSWASYFDYEANRGEQETILGTNRLEHEAYRKRENELQARVQVIAPTIPSPETKER